MCRYGLSNALSPPRFAVADVRKVSSIRCNIEVESADVMCSGAGASDGIDVNALSLVAIDESGVD